MIEKRAIIPNMFTMGNLIMGFLAIVFASKSTGITENLAIAGVFIFVASIFDLMDGALARALNVVNPIGVQLDSLADSVSYGIAPGFISYQAYLYKFPEIGMGINGGMLIATLFPLCATFRLAKFNLGEQSDGFTGLPSPAAGVMIASIPAIPFAIVKFYGPIDYLIPVSLFLPLFIIIALLMVSTVDYSKLFSVILKKGQLASFITVVTVATLLLLGGMLSVFLITTIYTIYGMLVYAFKSVKSTSKTGDNYE